MLLDLLIQPTEQYNLRQGPEGLRANVEVDDFQATWGSFETLTEDENYRGYAGNIHYVQYIVRDHPLVMRPGQQYSWSSLTSLISHLRTNSPHI